MKRPMPEVKMSFAPNVNEQLQKDGRSSGVLEIFWTDEKLIQLEAWNKIHNDEDTTELIRRERSKGQ